MQNQTYKTNKDLKEAHKHFPDNMGRGYKNYEFIYGKMFNILLEVPKNSKVLDIGCNSGEISLMLKEMNNCDVYGIDLVQELVDKARIKGVHAVCGDAEHIPFPKDTFDVCFMGEVIEHTYEPEKILKEVKRILKHNGKLVGATADEDYLYQNNMLTWDDERLHAQSYGMESMNKLVSKHFKDVKVYRNTCPSNVVSVFFIGYK